MNRFVHEKCNIFCPNAEGAKVPIRTASSNVIKLVKLNNTTQQNSKLIHR
jgi:hypothetical protein